MNIEERYVSLSHREQILKDPGMYIGSTKTQPKNIFVANQIDDVKEAKVILARVNYNPGFIKIFDEIITNASDHYIRTGKVKNIKINVTEDSISVENDGPGIPVEIHKKHKVHVPEMIFARLLTSENYDDKKEKFVGGRHGLGAKLTNIYSKRFIVETADGKNKFKQEYYNNNSKKKKFSKRSYKTKQFTKITYYPDFDRFEGVDSITPEIQKILLKRSIDIATYCPKVKVYYNGTLVPMKAFKDYMGMFIEDKKEIFTEKLNDKWEIGIAKSLTDNFMQNSMVNGVSTLIGGTHVDLITNKIVKEIKENLEKKYKKTKIKPNDIKSRLFLFVNCQVSNPEFDTQTKETLITKLNDKVDPSPGFIKKILTSSILEEIIDLILLKEQQDAKRKLRGEKVKRLRVAKLQDAIKAGTNESEKCSLFLTEGDSAASTAIEGFSVVGSDYFGSFPLKGKPLNVRDATLMKVKDNAEVKNIISALGLEFGRIYKSTKDLRYGKIVIMTDADVDGNHIKGLIINLFDTYWKELLQLDFLYEFVTPIVKATKGKETKYFYKLDDYEQWKNSTNTKPWFIKYYKGLGTIEDKESKMFFKRIKKHLIKFNYENGEYTEDRIDMLFRKNRANDRKAWLETYNPNTLFDKFSEKTTYNTFIDNEMIEFSMEDNIRSIPSVIDGIKPSQRKVLHTLFKKNYKNEVKLSLFSGAVTETAAYHHGPASLEQTIVGMAQTFVNSNNVNLLEPKGQFGTRTHGGSDASASRYIFTKLNPITKDIFNKLDENVLNYLDDDGFLIEPEYFVPIVPVALVNGSKGIGSGYSTDIPKFNIKDIIKHLKVRLAGKHNRKLLEPYYEKFKGEIVTNGSEGKFITRGTYRKINDNEIQITELPIGVWTENYHSHLDKLIENKIIKDYIKRSNNADINIIVIFNRGELLKLEKEGDFFKTMNLETTIAYTNMMAFDKNNKLKKYNTPEEIVDDFYEVRLEYYQKRKDYIISKLEYDRKMLYNRMKFIRALLDDDIILKNKKKAVLVTELEAFGLVMMGSFDGTVEANYDYLLNMRFINLTNEKLHELKNTYTELKNKIKQITETDIKDMWIEDLDNLLKLIK